METLLPSLEEHEDPPLFEVGDANISEYLNEHGYVVIRNVADEEDTGKAKEFFWKFLNEQAGMDRNQPETWKEKFYQIGAPSTGIINSKGIGQSDFLWHLRLLPAVKQTFSQVWKTDDLLTSFDGANLFRPWHREGWEKYKTRGGWFHVDQGKEKRGRHCIQGMVTLFDATPATGGLCVIPGSHKEHDKLISEAPKSTTGDFILVPPSSELLQRRKILVSAPAGSLILWDSRTIHCNCPSMEMPTMPTDDMIRMVGYVCMTPQKLASLRTLKLREEAFRSNITTTHWPHYYYPSTVAAPNMTDNDLDAISEAQAALIGIDRLQRLM
mmetsp:Transcript_6584/g.8022  ORF Transcript_6584/g.8022 Transcript_6584/m.8022 type:complete len:326 (+) Transcript_6584:262-1239(+)